MLYHGSQVIGQKIVITQVVTIKMYVVHHLLVVAFVKLIPRVIIFLGQIIMVALVG
jgi:hypothetical protein